MPSNVVLNPGAAGATAATAQISHDGDTAQLQLIGLMGIAGTEDAYTAAKINGDATNGLDVDVTRLPALPAGTNNIGDVDILSVVPGTGATNLGKAEDTAHASGDVGVMALTVRQDTAAALGGLDADYQPLISDASGRLHVNVGVLPALPAGTNNIGDVDVLTLPALPAGTNNIGDIDVLTVPAPLSTSGGGTEAAALRVTLANDSTGLVSVDDNGGSLTVDGSVSLAAAIPAGTNNIGDVDVLSLPALPAGTNNIGDVDVLTMPAVYAEDAAHSTGESGVLTLGVRRDANTSLVDLDGDRAPFQVDANGNLKVAIISGAGSGGTAIADSAAFTAGTTSLTPIGGYRDDTAPDTVAEGEAAAVRITTNRAIHVNLRDASGNEVAVGGGTQYAEDAASAGGEQLTLAGAVRQDTLAANTSLDGDYTYLKTTSAGRLYTSSTIDAALPAGTNNIGDVDVLSLPALPAGTNNIGDVDVLSLPALPAGTNNIGDVDVLTLPNVTLAAGTNTNEVVGDAAHDAPVAGNPLLVGGEGRTSDITAVANGDVCRVQLTTVGKQVNYPYAVPGNTWNYAAASGGITNTTGVSARAAAGAGIRNYITRVQVINGHATVSTDVQIRDGASGTVLWRGFAQAAGGGVACDFDPPLRGTANTLVEVACGTTGSATYFNLQGFSSAE